MSKPNWTTRTIEQRDWDAWRRLFTDYCAFYERPVSEEQLRLVWSWIHDERLIDAIVVVEDCEGSEPVGIAHLRSWVRSLRGEIAGYLDDLYVDPEFRGSGATEALFDAIANLGVDRGWSIVRWTTAEDNYRARGAYDHVATRTHWLTYEMAVKN